MVKDFIHTTMLVAEQPNVEQAELMGIEPEPAKIVGKCPIRIRISNIIAYHPIPYASGRVDNDRTMVSLASGVQHTVNIGYKEIDDIIRSKESNPV